MNGDEAVKTIQKNMVEFHAYQTGSHVKHPRHFDANILDLSMPIMDGYEACKQIN